MKLLVGKFLAGATTLTIAGGIAFAAQAQESAPENLIPGEQSQSAAPKSFDAAFPDMVSEPMVQGDLVAKIVPLVQPWSVRNAQSLAAVIDGIGAEGLDPKDYDLAALRTAIASGPSQELDELASRSFGWLVEDLRDGRTPMDARKQWFVVDRDRDVLRTGDLLTQALESGDIAGTLAQLTPAHPDYAQLKAALAKTQDPAKRKLIRANMDRWRWLERDLGSQYLITNVPEYQLRLTVNDKIISTYRTIVGKPGRTATPQLAETVEGVIFNPTWTVPQSIVKGEGLGAKVLNNPGWAKAAGYKATKGENGWITVVQQPGPANSLGRMKLDMPNPHAIFLHDTPSRGLFNQDDRALSHGCIRTERALELAITMAILGKGATKEEAVEVATSGEYTRVPIVKEMPVYITYFTVATDINGKLATFKDIYGRDEPVLASLDQPRVSNRANETDEEVIVIEDDLRTS
ncbi:L,D-transpeptidase family protein [Altererythrobacter arenosus]|uniref:L,D-transpeptidase family protein n=1 Tax=Altererythrobacter arenosus TaxID=3032592 RepID=A0ABY8FQ85_9SPHN|nr:L,D-transpeptidase family protein [Altererythrobacter sp. CAU 1644]WFL76068.1 L,D-transpeptidase family protein [Altererythrobacter sp. CAU 1644]